MPPADFRGEARELERLVDEYAQADGLDRRRRERLAKLIVETAQRTGLAREAGDRRTAAAPDEALRRIDAWLCDLKDLAVKDGLHIYGRAPTRMSTMPPGGQAPKPSAPRCSPRSTAAAWRRARPARPARGRRDVLPTGRNLFTADPRTLPTPTAMELGRLAADEVVRAHLQTHGEMPRAVVIDLWGSATLRTGGEEIAQGLALMGCRPIWDAASGRVTGIEVLPPAAIGRAARRRDLAHLRLVPRSFPGADRADRRRGAGGRGARRDRRRKSARGGAPRRDRRRCRRLDAFSAPRRAPMAPASRICSARDADSAAIGAAYLAAASHAYGGADGDGNRAPALRASASPTPTCSCIPATIPAAICSKAPRMSPSSAALPRRQSCSAVRADLVMLDMTDPQRPRARPLAAALARIVRARAVNPRFIAGQMRHGPRGAAEFAETVDRLVGFAETTDAVASELFDLLHDAYVADPQVRDFLLRENPQPPRAASPNGSKPRGGAASGIRAATISMRSCAN